MLIGVSELLRVGGCIQLCDVPPKSDTMAWPSGAPEEPRELSLQGKKVAG